MESYLPTSSTNGTEERTMTERSLLNILAGSLVVVGVVTIILTVLVLIHLDDVTTARVESAQDSCNLVVGLVRAGETARTRAKVEHYIQTTVLHDCHEYAVHTVYHPDSTADASTTTTTKGK